MPWGIVYYKRPDETVPAEDFLDACPTKVEALLIATLDAVRDAPPPAFSGGGKWEAMHGEMGGYYEVRGMGPGHVHYRLFCILENASPADLKKRGFDRPQIVVINGLVKPNAKLFTGSEYKKHVSDLGDDYLSKLPRPIAT
jgi:hypothetical protein